MSFPREILYDACMGFGLQLTEAQLDAFARYADFLVEYNRKVNLTAITDGVGIATAHFADSLLTLTAANLPEGSSLVDVGSGAGFPGVALKIVRPDLQLTLLDALNKRLVFLKALSEMLGQQNTFIHARAEQAGTGPLRERFDFAAARAVAGLPALCEYCLPLVRVGGRFIALKGPAAEAELHDAQRAINLLGGGQATLTRRSLPGGEERVIVVMDKISPTPKKYPRQRINIAKNPL
jgi:16S rRNA (guanine(527)-N(7))-methyltransferase RsmG